MTGTRWAENSRFLEQIKLVMTFIAWTAVASGACSKTHGPVGKGEKKVLLRSLQCQRAYRKSCGPHLGPHPKKLQEGWKEMSQLGKSGHWIDSSWY